MEKFIKPVKVLSLFDGISTGRLALEELSIPVERYDTFEIDAGAIAISTYQAERRGWTDIVRHGDVRELNLADYVGYDLVLFGSPCQDFSSLNKVRQGLAGAKSSLFHYGAACVKSGQFKHFLCENVRMKLDARAAISECLDTAPLLVDSAVCAGSHRPRNYWTDVQWAPTTKAVHANDLLEDGWIAGRSHTGTLTTHSGVNEAYLYRRMAANWQRLVAFKEMPDGIYQHGTLPKMTKYFNELEDGKRYAIRAFTPEEREALMTLPVGYTADSKRYYKTVPPKTYKTGRTVRNRVTGNGWTLSIIKDIFSEMFLK